MFKTRGLESNTIKSGLTLLAAFAAIFASVGVAEAGCRPDGSSLSDVEVSTLIANPERVLQNFREPDQLANMVFQLAARDYRSIPAFGRVAINADPRQKSAIGTGFYRAYTYCGGLDLAWAQKIDKAAKSVSDSQVQEAYRYAELEQNELLMGVDASISAIEKANKKTVGPRADTELPDLQNIPDPFGDQEDWR